jgi:hypothetical protein
MSASINLTESHRYYLKTRITSVMVAAVFLIAGVWDFIDKSDTIHLITAGGFVT